MRIQSGILLTMGGERYENGYVDAENGKITAFGSMNDAPVYIVVKPMMLRAATYCPGL